MDYNDFNYNQNPTGTPADSAGTTPPAPPTSGSVSEQPTSTGYTAQPGEGTTYHYAGSAIPGGSDNNSYNCNPNNGYTSNGNYAPGGYYNAPQGAAPGKPPKPPKAPKAKKSHKAGTKVVALCLCCALVGGAVGGGSAVLVNHFSGNQAAVAASGNATSLVQSSRTAALNTAYVDTDGQEMTAAQIYQANVNSCVGITANITYNVWGYTTTAAASGSGFVLTADGYIVTNYHVVEDSLNNDITVTLYDGTTYAATVVGYDSDNDIAVLKVDPESDLTPVVLGSSDSLSVGDKVVAIGNPLGELTFSLTEGVVSALNREVTLSFGTMNLIQTDCAINSGNSGGPLFNSYGELVGITNAKYSSSSSSSTEASIDNIGFAIPIDQVKNIISSIIENGYAIKPYLGVYLSTVDASMANAYNMTEGAYVQSVEEGSCAEKAGIQANDTIISCDGQAVTTADEVSTIKNSHAPGDTMTITVLRDGEELTFDVVLDEQPVTQEDDSTTQQLPQQSMDGYSYGNGNQGNNGYSTNPFSYFGF